MMMRRASRILAISRHDKRPALTYFVVVLVFGVLFSASLQFWNLRPVGCRADGYGLPGYMGSCSAPTFGDFEHGALLFGLEKDAVSAVQHSDVVYLGFSHGMVSLSSDATNSYFRSAGLRFYNLGVSGEFSSYFDLLLPRLHVRPKVVVIDAEPFFSGVTTPETLFIKDHPWRARLDYTIKEAWEALQRRYCEGTGGLATWLCGTTFSSFRSTATGRLIIDYSQVYGKPLRQIPVATEKPVDRGYAETSIELGKAFLARHGLDPACTIIMAPPNSFGNEGLARAIAQGLGAPFVDAPSAGIFTVDTAHMDPSSANIWSERFWSAADPIIKGCIEKYRRPAISANSPSEE